MKTTIDPISETSIRVADELSERWYIAETGTCYVCRDGGIQIRISDHGIVYGRNGMIDVSPGLYADIRISDC